MKPELLAGLAATSVAATFGFTLLAIGAARGCSSAGRVDGLEARLAAVELRMDGAGGITADRDGGAPATSAIGVKAASPSTGGLPPPPDPAAPTPRSEPNPACALAKVAAYQAWDDAAAKAKANASANSSQCASVWSDKKKQACYFAAGALSRAAQAARDAVMKGGTPARDAVRNVKDDGGNDAVGRARAASEAAFAQCRDSDP